MINNSIYINLTQIEKAVSRATHSFSGSQERWEETPAGISDTQLLARIAEEFGIQGGGSMENGWVEYIGGNNPRLIVQDEDFNTIAQLKGRGLITAVRTVIFEKLYKKQPEQLTLF